MRSSRKLCEPTQSCPCSPAFGVSLTQLASAYLMEPAIADRLTAICGPDYPGTPAPPGSVGPEYNLSIDITAAQVVRIAQELIDQARARMCRWSGRAGCSARSPAPCALDAGR